MDVLAVANGVRQSPRKVSEVAALVRDRRVEDALVILEHTPRRAALPVAKVIRSAAANATNNAKLKADSLVIASIEVNHGTAMKRYRPAARGMAQPYKRRSSNIKVVVRGEKPAAKPKTKAKSPKKEEVK